MLSTEDALSKCSTRLKQVPRGHNITDSKFTHIDADHTHITPVNVRQILAHIHTTFGALAVAPSIPLSLIMLHINTKYHRG